MPIFVIHKHKATSLHYDFRLQFGRKLKSWAVPKGPSTDPRQKRLAMFVEDHALSYANFEGVIPQGRYGAGPVMIWDKGTFRNIKKKKGKQVPLNQCIKNGQIEVWLNGKKLQGGYALIRMGKEPADKRWLLIKMRDEHADARRNPVKSQTKSVKTGRTIAAIAKSAKR